MLFEELLIMIESDDILAQEEVGDPKRKGGHKN
jgi:hypothetical protein